jgi:hypothetical protein
MTTYVIVQSSPSEWIIERRAPGQAPSYIWGGYRSAEQAQLRADELTEAASNSELISAAL